MKTFRICILDAYYPPSYQEHRDYDDEIHIRDYMDECGYKYEYHEIHKETAETQIRELVKSKNFDIFLNLCDGVWMDETPGIEVVKTLSYYNVPYTGADERFYEPTREQMKIVCDMHEIKTPKYILTSQLKDVELAVELLHFPMIIKHYQSYASIGLHSTSRVETKEALYEQMKRMLAEYDKVLIEEFIDGREFSVLVVENAVDRNNPIVYTPIEFKFPPEIGPKGFKSYELKWVDINQMHECLVEDESLIARLKKIAKTVFLGLHGTGYGRCDIRMDLKKNLYLLEINSNCGMFYSREAPGSADYILMNDPNGHVGFIELILRAAFNRVKKKQKWRLINHPERGFGLYASHPINPGEIILSSEHNLLHNTNSIQTSLMNKNTYQSIDPSLFRYLQPLTDNIWMIRRNASNTWIPVNHSCDPSAWMDDLNLVARRFINAGEEITLEYATIMDEIMPLFTCNCGSANCRGIISNRDYKLECMTQYEEHFSDYIRQKRNLSINSE